jgi:hypothetical protein
MRRSLRDDPNQVDGGRKEMTIVFTLQKRTYVLGWQAQGGCAVVERTDNRQAGCRVNGLSARGETVHVASKMSIGHKKAERSVWLLGS